MAAKHEDAPCDYMDVDPRVEIKATREDELGMAGKLARAVQ